jgi:hypothetical protein
MPWEGLSPSPKEEIVWLEVRFGILVAMDISLIAWLAQIERRDDYLRANVKVDQ